MPELTETLSLLFVVLAPFPPTVPLGVGLTGSVGLALVFIPVAIAIEGSVLWRLRPEISFRRAITLAIVAKLAVTAAMLAIGVAISQWILIYAAPQGADATTAAMHAALGIWHVAWPLCAVLVSALVLFRARVRESFWRCVGLAALLTAASSVFALTVLFAGTWAALETWSGLTGKGVSDQDGLLLLLALSITAIALVALISMITPTSARERLWSTVRSSVKWPSSRRRQPWLAKHERPSPEEALR